MPRTFPTVSPFIPLLLLASACPAPKPTTGASETERHEPMVVDLPAWPPAESTVAGAHHKLTYRDPGSSCRVELDRWWGLPSRPGGPMAIASKRAVTVDGQEMELLTTSAFDGIEQRVQVVFHRDRNHFQVRLTFYDCGDKAVQTVLEATRIAR